MCLGEPGCVRTIDGSNATVETADGTLEVSLMVLEAQHRTVQPGDWVMVSIGLAIDTLEPDHARALSAELAALTERYATPEVSRVASS